MRIIVVGGGIIGATSALALAERGHDVELVEARGNIAEGTSHANGGGITPLHSEPWNSPGLFSSLFAYMGRKNAPWRLPVWQLPALRRWGARFLAQSRRDRFVDNARANIRLGLYSLECLQRWCQRYGFDYAQTTAGSMQLFHDRQALEQALALRRQLIEDPGQVVPLDRSGLVAQEPALAPVADKLAGALYFPAHQSGDAARFAMLAARQAEKLGAVFSFNEKAQALKFDRNRFRALQTDRRLIEADACVVAAGSDSPGLLADTGIPLPIQPVRGYSATFHIDSAEHLPQLPLLDVAHRFVTLRLHENGFRIAGLADFAGHKRAVAPGRMDVMLEGARRLFPSLADQLTPARGRLWAGLRPVTPDGRPLLGKTPAEGVFVNAGHGPMGWTMACGSADLLSALVDGRPPGIAAEPYSPQR
ncbi:MAG TPA: FAD-dependent oxidoreductase [Wenzhouxiangella sp.]|nr:FAD-dependent oxidoreductase [Wenzhouxiangella sp.]